MECAYLMEAPTDSRLDRVQILKRQTTVVSDGVATQIAAARDRAYGKWPQSTRSKTSMGTRQGTLVVWPQKGQQTC
jgi:hypothetical protein